MTVECEKLDSPRKRDLGFFVYGSTSRRVRTMPQKTAPLPTPHEKTHEQAAPAEAREVEVKLTGAKRTLAAIPSLDALAGAKWKSRSQRMIATYFDTQSDDLRQAGMTLRVRQTGASRIMTLKWDLDGQSPFSRGESEVPVKEEAPNVDLFHTDVSTRITAVTEGKDLIPRFQTLVRRKIGEIQLGETRIEIAMDDGEIIAGPDRLPLGECELELKSGDAATLYRLAEKLIGAGLVLDPAQKSERGYLLARKETPDERKATRPILGNATSVENAMSSIIENALEQFIGNWPAFLDADSPESVHQMRVALRRLRAALGQFEKALPNAGFMRFRETAKRLANELGPARDYDVLVALITQGPMASFPAENSFEPLLRTLADQRQSSYQRAKETIHAPETSRFVLELQGYVSDYGWRNKLTPEQLPHLASPARDFAGEILERLYRRSRKLGKSISTGDSKARHELRISLKNLRYCAEFFSSIYDSNKVMKFTRTAGALQDALGAHNDAASAMNLIEQDMFSAQSRAAGIILGWCACEVHAPELHLKDYWISFKNSRCFWRN